MSIDELDVVLSELCRLGKLVYWKPECEDDETVHRRMYMRPDVHKWVIREPNDQAGIVYVENVRRFLKGFVIGEPFDNSDKLKNLDVDQLRQPDRGYYAFRQQRVEPGARIFGAFAAENIFIATHRKPRKGINWAKEKVQIQATWDQQFIVRIKIETEFKNVPLPRISDRNRTRLTSNNRRTMNV